MTVYDFAVGQTNPATFPTETFKLAVLTAIDREADAFNRYPGALGHEGLRRLMAERESRREGVSLDHNLFALTNGSMQAVTMAGQAFKKEGQRTSVITEEFTYSGTIAAYKGIGLNMVGIGMDEGGMRMDLLASQLESMAAADELPGFIYTLTTYQNPTGTCMSRERKLELIELAGRYEIPVVEDNCYGDVHFDGEVPPTVFSLAPDLPQVYIGSLSKIFAPGVRLGYLYANEPLFSRVVRQRHDAGSNYFAAAVLAEFYKNGISEHAAVTTPALVAKRDLLLDALAAELTDICVWSRPSGGLFLWLRMPEDIDMVCLKEKTEARRFFYAAGSDFHVEGSTVPYIRLAFGHVPDDIIEEGIGVLSNCIRESRRSNEARQFDSLF